MKGRVARKNGILRENLFSALIISYIAIFILSFVVGIIIIHTSEKQTRESIHDYNTVRVNKLQSSVTRVYDSVCEFAEGFVGDSTVTEVLTKDEISPNNYKELMPLLEKLNDFRQRKSYIHNIFVYCSKSDCIVSSAAQPPEKFYKQNPKYSSYEYSDWRRVFLKNKQYNKFYPMEKLTDGAQVITFVNTLYSNNDVIGSLVIQIDAEEILGDVFFNEFESGSSLYILDNYKNILVDFGAKDGDIDVIPYIDTSRKGYVENNDRVIIFTIAPGYRWTYAVSIPESVMFEQLLPMKMYFALIMIVYALSAVTILLVAMRKNKKRMQTILKKLGIKEIYSGNVAVGDIVSGIDVLVANNMALSDSVKDRENYIRQRAIIDVLTGKTNNDCEEKLKEAGIVFKNKLLCEIVVQIEDEGVLSEVNSKKSKLSHTCVINVFLEMLGKIGESYIAELGDKHIAFILNIEDEDSFTGEITDICTRLRTILSAEFEMAVEIGISTIADEISMLNKLYNEALIALDYKTAPGQNVIFYNDVIGEKELVSVYYYPSNVEERIINYVRVGDEKNLVEILDALIEKNIKNPSVRRSSKNCFYYDLIGTYMKATDMVGYDSELMHKLVSKDDDNYISIKNSVLVLCGELINICRLSQKLQEVGVDKTAEKIKQYVDDNYSDINLGVLTIADEFGLSRQTVSKKFSQAFDEKLNEYITEVRMSKAKELLITTNLNGSQIAEMVGYAESSTFIRVFKKLYGVTPMQYKKNIMM